MLRQKWIAMVAMVAIAAMPAFAGGDHKKCSGSTQECLDYMANKLKSSGWVGVELEAGKSGHYTVNKVIPGSPAEEAGIRKGDVLFAMNGIEISDENEEALQKAKKEWKPGKSVDYTIQRNGRDRQVEITLAPMPTDVLAKWIGTHMLEHATTDVAAK